MPVTDMEAFYRLIATLRCLNQNSVRITQESRDDKFKYSLALFNNKIVYKLVISITNERLSVVGS